MQKEKGRGFFCPLFLQDVKVNKERVRVQRFTVQRLKRQRRVHGSRFNGSAVHGSTAEKTNRKFRVKIQGFSQEAVAEPRTLFSFTTVEP
jgi:hypothetical protein